MVVILAPGLGLRKRRGKGNGMTSQICMEVMITYLTTEDDCATRFVFPMVLFTPSILFSPWLGTGFDLILSQSSGSRLLDYCVASGVASVRHRGKCFACICTSACNPPALQPTDRKCRDMPHSFPTLITRLPLLSHLNAGR